MIKQFKTDYLIIKKYYWRILRYTWYDKDEIIRINNKEYIPIDNFYFNVIDGEIKEENKNIILIKQDFWKEIKDYVEKNKDKDLLITYEGYKWLDKKQLKI